MDVRFYVNPIEDRTEWLPVAIDLGEVEIKDVKDQLEAAKGEDVVVEIASPGGMISEGLLIYNELKNYGGESTWGDAGWGGSNSE